MRTQVPKVQGTRQHYRIWFEYYRIAKFDGTKEQKANLKALDKDSGFYREWEPITKETKFDDWWREKKYLFGDPQIKEINSVSNNPLTLNISIPLTESVTKSLSQIRELIEERHSHYWKTVKGIKNPATLKNRAIPSNYKINGEIKGSDQHSIQLIYKIWIESGRPIINSEFLDKVENWFRSRPRSKWLPKNLQPKTEDGNWDENKQGQVPDDQNIRKQIKNQGAKGVRNEIWKWISSNTNYFWELRMYLHFSLISRRGFLKIFQ